MHEMIKVGDQVKESPVGPGKITAITEAGYPKVSDIAVVWLVRDDGATWGAKPNADPASDFTIHPLCKAKAAHIMTRGFFKAGYILLNPETNERALVDGAVRWLSNQAYWDLMHPPESAPVTESAQPPEQADQAPNNDKHQYTYASTQATKCAVCSKFKHTPLRVDRMGGYVCLTCIDRELERLLETEGDQSTQQPAAQIPSAAPESDAPSRTADAHRFEKFVNLACELMGSDEPNFLSTGSKYVNQAVQQLWAAWQEQAANPAPVTGAIPAGWKLVPIAPTDVMREAAAKADDEGFAAGRSHGASGIEIYEAMINAAPAAQEQAAAPIMWQYRAHYAENTVTPGWGDWREIVPRNMQTIEMAVQEMRGYIDNGNPYELRALCVAPQPASQADVIIAAQGQAAEPELQAEFNKLKSALNAIFAVFDPVSMDDLFSSYENGVGRGWKNSNLRLEWVNEARAVMDQARAALEGAK